MHVSDIWDVLGGMLTLAVIAVILTKPNTASDLQAAGGAFTNAIGQAQKG